MKTNYCETTIKRLQAEYSFLTNYTEINGQTMNQLQILLQDQLVEIETIKIQIKCLKQEEQIELKIELSKLRKQLQAGMQYLKLMKKMIQFEHRVETHHIVEENLPTYDLLSIQDTLQTDLSDISSETLKQCYLDILWNDFDPETKDLESIILELKNRIKKEKLDDENIETIRILKRNTKNLIPHLEHSDMAKKRKLYQLVSLIRKILEPEKQQKYHDYRIDIVEVLCSKREFFPYLGYWIQTDPELINLKDQNGTSIFFLLFDHFFDSCWKELDQSKESYVKKEQYIQILNQIFANTTHEFTEQDHLILNQKIFYFTELIRQTNKSKREEMVSFIEHWNEAKQLLKVTDAEVIDQLDENNFLRSSDRTMRNLEERSKRHDSSDVFDFTHTDVIVFGHPRDNYYHHAFSIEQNERGNLVFHIHVVDFTNSIEDNNVLDQYTKGKFLASENETLFPKEGLKYGLSLQPFEPCHTLVYQIEMLPNGKSGKIDVVRGYTKVSRCISYTEMPKRMDEADETLKQFLYLFYNFKNHELYQNHPTDSLGDQLERTMLGVANKAVTNYFEHRHLPMIYKVRTEMNAQDVMPVMNELCGLLGKVSLKEANCFHQALLVYHQIERYSTQNLGHVGQDNGRSIPELFTPLTSYPTIVAERIVADLFLKDQILKKSMLRLYRSKFRVLAERANDKIRSLGIQPTGK